MGFGPSQGGATGYPVIPVRDSKAVVQCPVILGGKKSPASPIIYDVFGSTIREFFMKTKGSCRFDLFKSLNIEDLAGPSDDSNIIYADLGPIDVMDSGLHYLNYLVPYLQGARYIKIDKTHGADIVESYLMAS